MPCRDCPNSKGKCNQVSSHLMSCLFVPCAFSFHGCDFVGNKMSLNDHYYNSSHVHNTMISNKIVLMSTEISSQRVVINKLRKDLSIAEKKLSGVSYLRRKVTLEDTNIRDSIIFADNGLTSNNNNNDNDKNNKKRKQENSDVIPKNKKNVITPGTSLSLTSQDDDNIESINTHNNNNNNDSKTSPLKKCISIFFSAANAANKARSVALKAKNVQNSQQIKITSITDVTGKYKGEINANNESHGYGIEEWPNGNLYMGEFKNSKKNGYVVAKYFTGEVYKGEYKNNEREGYGIYKWPNGDVFQGEFKDGKKHGYGMFTWSNGNVEYGNWENGELVEKKNH